MTANLTYDEPATLLQFAGGSTDAFDILYYQYYEPVSANIFKIIQDRAATDDLVQEVFISFWNKRAQFTGSSKAGAWLFVVSYNRSISFLKRKATERLYMNRMLHSPLHAEVTEDEELQEKQFLLLKAAIDQLSPQRKKVIELCRFQGLSYEQAALELAISKNTVKEHLAKAGESIKKYVASHSDDLKLLGLVTLILWVDK